jgi:hypothetical protein
MIDMFGPPNEVVNCIFCGGTPTNREHVWPRWSHKYISKTKRKWHSLHAVEHKDRTDFRIIKHPGDPHDWQVKCVDERCNNGWMRRLEDKARPMLIPLLRGDEGRRYLGKKEQQTIATWIALKTFVQEYGPYSDKLGHHTQLKMLWKKQLPPSTAWRIWIGRYVEHDASALWSSRPWLVLPKSVAGKRKSRIARYYNSQAATYVIGKLFIHVVRCPYQFFMSEWRFPYPVSRKLARIWPLTGYDVIWPQDALSDLEAGYVVRAVHDFMREAGAGTAPAPPPPPRWGRFHRAPR